MALITCPECSGSTSGQASTCPRCGYPIKNLNLLAMEGEQPNVQAQVVELTAKRLKKHYAIAASLFVASMLLTTVSCFRSAFGNDPSWSFALSVGVMITSMFYLITVKALIWWHHR